MEVLNFEGRARVMTDDKRSRDTGTKGGDEVAQLPVPPLINSIKILYLCFCIAMQNTDSYNLLKIMLELLCPIFENKL